MPFKNIKICRTAGATIHFHPSKSPFKMQKLWIIAIYLSVGIISAQPLSMSTTAALPTCAVRQEIAVFVRMLLMTFRNHVTGRKWQEYVQMVIVQSRSCSVSHSGSGLLV
ncbi:MAG: hypothetical protein CL912_11710 [Deltaproteobacteria bacterium]|nr:hypothetical protein [Deltaproteobacteria bacterium]